MKALRPIREQVVVICGASSGMGRQAALEFARQGAKVIAAARGRDGLDSLIREIRAAGGDAHSVAADVSDYPQVRHIVRKALERYGRIDTWAHFAATSVYAPFRETTPEEFQRVMDVNLLGPAYAAMAALPVLNQHGGALIVISSLEAEVGQPNQSAYTASKHGLRGFMTVLRMELHHERSPVSVTNIVPGEVNTPFFRNTRRKQGLGAEPHSFIYQPETVVRAVLYAAQNPIEEIVIGAPGGLFLLAHRLMPRLTEALVAWRSYRRQRRALLGPKGTREERRRFRRGNIFRPIPAAEAKVHGPYDEQSTGSSAYTWLQMHPGVRRTLNGALIVGAAATALLIRRPGQR